MRFLIFGTGAVGAYLGARLARAGHPVVVLARPAWAESIRRRGIVVDGEPAAPVEEVLTEIPQDFDLGPDGVVLLTVKAYDCGDAARILDETLRGNSPVVCLLNGIGNEETLEARLGRGRVTGATLTTAVAAPQPGTIRIERERGLALEDTSTSATLAQAFAQAGVPTRLVRRRASIKWSKLPTNLVANASSAILGWTPRRVMGQRDLYRLELETLRETFRVMRGLGIRPIDLPGVPVRWFAQGVRLPAWLSRRWLGGVVARGRGDKMPSFHRDIGRHRTEAPWLHGAVIAHGRRVGVPTPANDVLLATLLDLVEARDDPAVWRDRPERLLERAGRAGVPGLDAGEPSR